VCVCVRVRVCVRVCVCACVLCHHFFIFSSITDKLLDLSFSPSLFRKCGPSQWLLSARHRQHSTPIQSTTQLLQYCTSEERCHNTHNTTTPHQPRCFHKYSKRKHTPSHSLNEYTLSIILIQNTHSHTT
jgi:hypothetical protein